MDIKTKHEEPLLNRIYIEAVTTFEKETPSKEVLKKELSKKLGESEASIVIISVKNLYGERKAIIKAHVYKDENTLKFMNPVKKAKVKKEPAPAKGKKK